MPRAFGRRPERPRRSLRRALTLRGLLRLRPAGDIWRLSALSAVIAVGVPEVVVLLLAGHLELALYTSAGGLCALYGHGLPYAARARAVAWVVMGMTAGMAVASTTAALTGVAAVRVAVIALLAAAFKMGCDATRIGPPGMVVPTFITSSAAFVPTRPADLPVDLALVLLGGVLSWLVCMAPALFRPHRPERAAVARALEATARLLRTAEDDPAVGQVRHEAAAAVHAAWHTLGSIRSTTSEVTALNRLVAQAGALTVHHRGEQADRLDAWARELRKSGPIPVIRVSAAESAELRGIAVAQAADARTGGWQRIRAALVPGSPLYPIGMRVALGGAAAGWTSMALGVERPNWAVLTAAATFVANTAVSWQRAVLRVLGSLGGVLLFTALVPVTRGPTALVVATVVLMVPVEAAFARNYGLGMLFVTPLALLMSEFAGGQSAHRLVVDRWLDTCVGAAVGVLVCFLVPNRRVAGRVEAALRALEEITATAPADPDRRAARARLAGALIEVREAADTADGEWWSAPLPEQRIVAAERAGHRALARIAVPVDVS
ncbi:FUSC family protein [Nocardia sp. CDC159]|uniref:FUSC family protein n=1 Tax=Nocardia pulmonis TaxID=2951408 RepID=A0A9X2E806_9NOCA|nr:MULTISPECIES: FUSC family protein [Nocardia]MCM6775296.1 FUSC family protein [Nocardia pulmonis]MCM6787970.1 FUSC family protein [Nocardia sp. CDC159]